MKALALVFCLGSFSAFADIQALEETHKKQRGLRHEENRKWSLAKEECYSKYPQGYKASHSDYDKQFKCREDIEDARQAFENKMRAEICEKHNVSCQRAPASADE